MSFLVKCVVSLFFLSAGVLSLHSQVLECLKEAKKMAADANYERAIIAVNNCVSDFERAQNFRSAIEGYQLLVEYYISTNQLESASERAYQALHLAKEKLDENDTLVALSHNAIANVLNTGASGYYLAIDHADSADRIFKKLGLTTSATLAETLNMRGLSRFRLSQLDEALVDFEKSREIKTKILGAGHPGLATILNDIAGVHFYKGDNVSVIKALEEIIKNLEANFPKGSPAIARPLTNIGVVHMELANYFKSIEYLDRVVAMQAQFKMLEHPQTAVAYNFLGMNYWYLAEYERAKEYFDKSIVILEKVVGTSSQLYLLPVTNRAGMYVDMGRYNDAISSYQSTIKIYEKIGNQSGLATAYYSLGKAFLGKGDLEPALNHFRKALEMRKQFTNGIRVARSYYRIGEVQMKMDLLDSALKNFQRAIVELVTDFNDMDIYANPKGVSDQELTGIFQRKAEAFERRFKDSGDVKDLERALDLKLLGIEVQESTIRDFNSEQYRTWMGQYAQSEFEKALKIALQLNKITGEAKFLSVACRLINQSKSQNLRAKFVLQQAESISGIPDSLLAQERALKVDISYNEDRLSREQSRPKIDSLKVEEYSSVIFNKKRTYQELIDLFEDAYPRYFKMKYAANDFEVSQLLDNLSFEEAVIEYFIGEENAYVMYVDSDKYQVLDLGAKEEIIAATLQFRDLISNEPRQSPQQQLKQYTQSSYSLFKMIFQPLTSLIGEEIETIRVIPDGELGYIPFEVLVRDVSGTGFSSLNYLQNRFNISYAYSTTFLNDVSNEQSGNGVVGFAPTYASHHEDSITNARFRSAVSPLQWNVSEVENLITKLGANGYLGASATEASFKDVASEYKVLHLAMHSLVDEIEPQRSRLVFSTEDGSGEDGLLHSFELNNLQLKADLAVLSACQTGYGKLEKGEGVLSLARSFSIAGVPSMVVTHWNVGDRSSNELMTSFYENLSEGKTKSESLKQAKSAYLNQAHPTQTHPFYWAAFVTIGEDSPVFERRSYLLIFVVSVLVLIVVLIINRSRHSN